MQSIFLLAFWTVLLSAIAVGWRAGDRDDRKAMVAILGAAIMTGVAYTALEGRMAMAVVVMADLALLAYIANYALRSVRHWPLWFAGFHAAGTFFTLAALAIPGNLSAVPERLAGLWSLLALVAMIAGLLLDQRQGVASAGSQS